MKSLVLCSFLSVKALCLQAQSGTPDSSFGTNGITVSNFGSDERIYATATQPDGKILAGGVYDVDPSGGRLEAFGLARYTAKGRLDATFGTKGFVYTPVGETFSGLNALAVQADGKILAAGYANLGGYYNQPVVLRYTKAGKVDSSFGTNGVAYYLPGYGKSAYSTAIALQSDGKILVAGYLLNFFTAETSGFLLRFDTKGKLDPLFAQGGKTIVTTNGYTRFEALAILPGDKILVAGAGSPSQSVTHFFLARCTANGLPDKSFGTGGRAFAPIDATSTAKSIALAPNGNIVLGGTSGFGLSSKLAVARFTGNGKPDSSFNGTGVNSTDVYGPDEGQRVAVAADGKTVLAGVTYQNALDPTYSAIVRYNPNGTPDNSFGKNGIALNLFGSGNGYIYTTGLLPDGNLICGGFTSLQNQDFTLEKISLSNENTIAKQSPDPIVKTDNGVRLLPNPAVSNTQVSYTLSTSGKVNITVYNAMRQPVAALVNTVREAGNYQFNWNLCNGNGTKVPAGIYRVVMVSHEQIASVALQVN